MGGILIGAVICSGFEAKKRFGLSVLNYVVTCNHIHLLVKDTHRDVIAQSMQLIAGRTAQEYNQRKNRYGMSGRTDIMPRLSSRLAPGSVLVIDLNPYSPRYDLRLVFAHVG